MFLFFGVCGSQTTFFTQKNDIFKYQKLCIKILGQQTWGSAPATLLQRLSILTIAISRLNHLFQSTHAILFLSYHLIYNCHAGSDFRFSNLSGPPRAISKLINFAGDSTSDSKSRAQCLFFTFLLKNQCSLYRKKIIKKVFSFLIELRLYL